MNDDMAKTLAILMEEMINQMFLLRQELERGREAVTREIDCEFIEEGLPAPELLGGIIYPSEVEV